jgi:hypothetical protein
MGITKLHAPFLVTGSYGGPEKIMRKLYSKYRSSIHLHAIANCECLDKHLLYLGDHAGVSEASQLIFLRPDLTNLNNRTCNEEIGERLAGGVDFLNVKIRPEIVDKDNKY